MSGAGSCRDNLDTWLDNLPDKEPTKEQPMSDTLLEPEDQTGEHQVTKSGICVIPGCPCRGWSAQETAGVELGNNWQRERFPVGARVEAIIPISRSRLGADIPVGTRGKVTSHCDDGRAWIFFDGYTEGHTFSEIRKYVRVVCTHQNDDERCPANATSEHQPAARGGGEAWSVQVLSRGARILAGSGSLEDKTIIADHLSGYVARQIVTEHNQYQALVAERERLLRTLRQVRNAALVWADSRYLETAQIGLRQMASDIDKELATDEQRSTSE